MFENKITQARLAAKIGVGQSNICDVLSGKRKSVVSFLKGVYKVLKIDAVF